MGNTPEKIARAYTVSGRVQGVGFRFFAQRWAHQLGLYGYVRNRSDGAVDVYAIGDQESLKEFKDRLAQGPRSAHVIRVDEREENVDNRYAAFLIEDRW
jgi:acylphosphatase